ncbi:MAG: hypothetical protein WBZ42_08830 [Halobacteriota archaeon]
MQIDKWTHSDPEALQNELGLAELLASDADQVVIDGKRIKHDAYWKKLAKQTASNSAIEYGQAGRPKSETPALHLKLMATAAETDEEEKQKLGARATDEFIVTYGILQTQLLIGEWQDAIKLMGTLIAELAKSSEEKVVHEYMLDHLDVYDRFRSLYNDLELEIGRVTLPISAKGSRDDILVEEWKLQANILEFMQHVRAHADAVSVSMKGVNGHDLERIYWLTRYKAALNKGMEDEKKGEALFEKAQELEARGAATNEIKVIIDQIAQLVTDLKQESTTAMNELIRLGDVPNIEGLRSSYETRNAQIDAFLEQVNAQIDAFLEQVNEYKERDAYYKALRSFTDEDFRGKTEHVPDAPIGDSNLAALVQLLKQIYKDKNLGAS